MNTEVIYELITPPTYLAINVWYASMQPLMYIEMCTYDDTLPSDIVKEIDVSIGVFLSLAPR